MCIHISVITVKEKNITNFTRTYSNYSMNKRISIPVTYTNLTKKKKKFITNFTNSYKSITVVTIMR